MNKVKQIFLFFSLFFMVPLCAMEQDGQKNNNLKNILLERVGGLNADQIDLALITATEQELKILKKASTLPARNSKKPILKIKAEQFEAERVQIRNTVNKIVAGQRFALVPYCDPAVIRYSPVQEKEIELVVNASYLSNLLQRFPLNRELSFQLPWLGAFISSLQVKSEFTGRIVFEPTGKVAFLSDDRKYSCGSLDDGGFRGIEDAEDGVDDILDQPINPIESKENPQMISGGEEKSTHNVENQTASSWSQMSIKKAFVVFGVCGMGALGWKLYINSSYYQSAMLKKWQIKVNGAIESLHTNNTAQLPALEAAQLTRLDKAERDQLEQANNQLKHAFQEAQTALAGHGAHRSVDQVPAVKSLNVVHVQWNSIADECKNSIQVKRSFFGL